jgi:ligand-binding sensor domain-containing protein
MAQDIFPEKFEGCNTDQFAIESEVTTAKIDNQELIRVIQREFDSKTKRNIIGYLSLQVIVNLQGESCLLSIENKTNVKTSKLNLKSNIDNNLKWEKPEKKVSAIFAMKFSRNGIAVKRLGVNANVGWHEISDKPSGEIKMQFKSKNLNTTNHPKIIEDKKTNSVWKLYTTQNSVIPLNMSRSVEIDNNGVVWYCTDDGLVKIENDNWTVLTSENSPLPSNKYGKTITTGLTVDKENNVWVESFGNVIMYNGENWIKYDTTNSPLKFVQEISIDRDGSVWFGTFYGLIHYQNGIWKKLTVENSELPSNNVREVYRDKSNTIWIATEKGVATLKDSIWTTYNTENSKLPSNSVTCINQDQKGNIWIGTNHDKGKGGLVKIDSVQNWTIFTIDNSKLPTNAICEIETHNDIVWLGLFFGGLVRIENDRWEIYNTDNSIVPHNMVYSIATDKEGNKWIATFGGLVYTTRK